MRSLRLSEIKKVPEVNNKECDNVQKEFNDLLDKMQKIMINKGSDYGDKKTCLANLEAVKDIGISPFVGVVIRLMDKFNRIKTFMVKGHLKVEDESINDTLIDISIYCLLAIILRRGEKK